MEPLEAVLAIPSEVPRKRHAASVSEESSNQKGEEKVRRASLTF